MLNVTGRKRLVTVLNRFGHWSSYDTLERIDTALENEQLNQMDEIDGICIPCNILPFSHLIVVQVLLCTVNPCCLHLRSMNAAVLLRPRSRVKCQSTDGARNRSV